MKPSNPSLAAWASAPLTAIDPAKAGNTNLAADPKWAECQAGARERAAEYEDTKSVITPADGLASWPAR